MKKQIAFCLMISMSSSMFCGNGLTGQAQRQLDAIKIVNSVLAPLVCISRIAEQQSRLMTLEDFSAVNKTCNKNSASEKPPYKFGGKQTKNPAHR